MKTFGKRYSCWSGYKCGKTPRLPRKKKKQYDLLLTLICKWRSFDMLEGSICAIAADYKACYALIKNYPILKRYESALDIIFHKENEEPVKFDKNGRLCWEWEDDNGLYTYGGLMPFCYNEKDAGDTWAYSGVKDLLYRLTDIEDFPAEVNSDLTLLKYIYKNLSHIRHYLSEGEIAA